MTFSTVQPFLRHGVWTTLHDRYGQAAIHALQELVEAKATYIERETKLKSDNQDPNLISYLMMEDGEQLEVMSVTVEILCCMSVEAFLNFYGVVRLGEEFYHRTFERLGILQKLPTLVATCQDILLPRGAEIATVIKRMFERRNSLVHPKAKDVSGGVHAHPDQADDSVTPAKNMVEDMRRFFRLFNDLDNDVGVIVNPSWSRSRENVPQ